MSDAFVYFWIIGAGLTLGIASVALPIYYFMNKKANKNTQTKRKEVR